MSIDLAALVHPEAQIGARVSVENLEKTPILAEIVQLRFRERRQVAGRKRGGVGEEHAPGHDVTEEILAP